ncbi:kinase-like domain-containing protein, partial [Dimargaris cristalligena]
RYRLDFIELERLGKGGFGTVYKVKNRLDNREYAVKKIYLLGDDTPLDKILRESTSLARLEHPNIVRYYSSWVEGPQGQSANRNCVRSTLTLHIQMQLCSTNLAEFLKRRNERLADRVLKLFKGIVEGVAYLHTHHMIHRDLKPSNIFLDVSRFACTPRIGDFGLVTTAEAAILEHHSQSASRAGMLGGPTPMTSGVGTVTYAAPEQLDGITAHYDTKADIFSLGIILFELLYPFSTGMERVVILDNLRRGTLPERFVTLRPVEASFILWLMATQPEQRPTAEEIL